MTADPTEADIMDRGAPPKQVFVVHYLSDTEQSFGTIGAWQAAMDMCVGCLAEEPARLRAFFDRNEDTLNDLGQQPAFAKAVGVIRAQFARAMGETT